MLVSGSELYLEGERDPLAALGRGHNRVDQNRRKGRRWQRSRRQSRQRCPLLPSDSSLAFLWAPSHPPRDPHTLDHRLYTLELVFM